MGLLCVTWADVGATFDCQFSGTLPITVVEEAAAAATVDLSLDVEACAENESYANQFWTSVRANSVAYQGRSSAATWSTESTPSTYERVRSSHYHRQVKNYKGDSKEVQKIDLPACNITGACARSETIPPS